MFVAMPTAMPDEPLISRFGSLAGRTRRLLLCAVVVVLEVDRLLVDVGEHLDGHRREAGLRVAHRGGGVAVDRAEVALAVDERVAQREVLGEPDEGVVQRDVAVRVVLAHHLADDRGALAVGARGREPHLAHRVEDRGGGRASGRRGRRAARATRSRSSRSRGTRPSSRPRCGRCGRCPGCRSSARWLLRVVRRRSSGERWLGHGSPEAHVREAARELRGLRGGGRPRLAPDRRRGSPRIAAASAGSSFERLSRTTHARWPSSLLARGLRLRARGRAVVASTVHERHRAIGPRQRLLDVGLGVADQRARGAQGPCRRRRARARRCGSTNGIVAIVEPTSRRSQRDGETVSCSSSAQRYGSARMPLPNGCASVSTVIQSSASAAARRRSCHVRSGSRGRVRWSVVIANQRASRSGSRRSRSATRRSSEVDALRDALLEALPERDLEGRADAVGRPDPGRHERLAGAVLRIGELAERRRRAVRRTQPGRKGVGELAPSSTARSGREGLARGPGADRRGPASARASSGVVVDAAIACSVAVMQGHVVPRPVVSGTRRIP